jgi:serine/threonine protein kinase
MLTVETEQFVPLSVPQQIGNYMLHRVIGQGSTCAVLEATDRLTGKDYAVKVMSYADLKSQNLLRKLERELSIIQSLHHDHIIRFREIIRDGDLIFIVTENCDGGDLFSSIVDGDTKDISTLKRLFHQIVLGVQYLHRQGIAHNDIKPENIVLDSEGNAKLIDFGFAKRGTVAGDDEKSGSLVYAAPEILSQGPYSPQKADIWSLGILLYVMTAAKFPFPDESDAATAEMIRHGKLMYPHSMDPEVEQLVRKLTKVNPKERPTIDDVLQDPFFDDLLLDGLEKPMVNGTLQQLQRNDVEDEMSQQIAF